MTVTSYTHGSDSKKFTWRNKKYLIMERPVDEDPDTVTFYVGGLRKNSDYNINGNWTSILRIIKSEKERREVEKVLRRNFYIENKGNDLFLDNVVFVGKK